jgi:hypothetical protein
VILVVICGQGWISSNFKEGTNNGGGAGQVILPPASTVGVPFLQFVKIID